MRYFYLLALRWRAAPAGGQVHVPIQRPTHSRSWEAPADLLRRVLVGQRTDMTRLRPFVYLLDVASNVPGAATSSASRRRSKARADQSGAGLVAFSIAG